MSDSLWPHGLYSPWNSPGQNTGVGSLRLSLLQGIFPTQGLNLGLPHCRQTLYQLSHKGSPRLLEWVAYPFLRGSPWPRDWTGVSCVAGRSFTNWAITEAPRALSYQRTKKRSGRSSRKLSLRFHERWADLGLGTASTIRLHSSLHEVTAAVDALQ